MAYQVVVPHQEFQLGTDRAAGLNSVILVLPCVWTTFDLTCVGPPFTSSPPLPSPFLEQMLN